MHGFRSGWGRCRNRNHHSLCRFSLFYRLFLNVHTIYYSPHKKISTYIEWTLNWIQFFFIINSPINNISYTYNSISLPYYQYYCYKYSWGCSVAEAHHIQTLYYLLFILNESSYSCCEFGELGNLTYFIIMNNKYFISDFKIWVFS